MKQIILVLLLCISCTAWASWSPAANDLVVNRSSLNTNPMPPMINSEGNVMVIFDRTAITTYGRALDSDWNKIGELLYSDPILSSAAYGFNNFTFDASSSLEKFVTYKNGDGYDSNNQPLPGKIITLNYINNVWSSSEFSLPLEYSYIDDIGISKNGQRIAIKTNLRSLEDNPFFTAAFVVFENILGAWVKVGEPIIMLDDIIWPTLDENGDNITFKINHGSQYEDNIIAPIRVFTYANGSWSQKGNNIYPNDDFDEHGRAVSISGDGQRIAISSHKANIGYFELAQNMGGLQMGPDFGCVRVYQYDNSDWQLISTLFGEDIGDQFGTNFHLSSNGNRIAIGSGGHDNYSGHIRVFDYNSSLNGFTLAGKYAQAGNDIDGSEYEFIGERFAMSGDGTTIVSMNASYSGQYDMVSNTYSDTLKTYSYGAPTDESVDTDGDGLTNATELSLGTNPNLVDTDEDGFPDGWEVSRNLDPTVNSSDFISNINGYGYYSTEQISDLRPGSTMIEIQNGQATLSMEVEQSDDLEIWTSGGTTNLQIPIDANSDTKFFRFKMAE